MADETVAATEFQNRAGLYMERAGKKPVFITKHNRPVRVLLDIDEYERLKARDTRHAYYADELPADVIETMKQANLDHLDPSLDDPAKA